MDETLICTEWDGGTVVSTVAVLGEDVIIRDGAGAVVEQRPATVDELALLTPPIPETPAGIAEQLASAQQQLETQAALIDALAARLGIDLTTLTP